MILPPSNTNGPRIDTSIQPQPKVKTWNEMTILERLKSRFKR